MFQGVFQGLTSEPHPSDDDTGSEGFDLLEHCSTGDAAENPQAEGAKTPEPPTTLATNEALLEVLQELQKISRLIAQALPHLCARP